MNETEILEWLDQVAEPGGIKIDDYFEFPDMLDDDDKQLQLITEQLKTKDFFQTFDKILKDLSKSLS